MTRARSEQLLCAAPNDTGDQALCAVEGLAKLMTVNGQTFTREGRRWRFGDLELFTAECVLTVKDFLYYDLIPPAGLGFAIEHWAAKPEYRGMLTDIFQFLRLGQAPITGQSDNRIANELLGAFKRGSVYLLRRRSGCAANRGAAQTEVKEKRESPIIPVVKQKTWIEIVLVDEDGEPVTGQSYRLKITDGSVRFGKLGPEGTIRVSGIEPGMCEISFLELDHDAWGPA